MDNYINSLYFPKQRYTYMIRKEVLSNDKSSLCTGSAAQTRTIVVLVVEDLEATKLNERALASCELYAFKATII